MKNALRLVFVWVCLGMSSMISSAHDEIFVSGWIKRAIEERDCGRLVLGMYLDSDLLLFRKGEMYIGFADEGPLTEGERYLLFERFSDLYARPLHETKSVNKDGKSVLELAIDHGHFLLAKLYYDFVTYNGIRSLNFYYYLLKHLWGVSVECDVFAEKMERALSEGLAGRVFESEPNKELLAKALEEGDWYSINRWIKLAYFSGTTAESKVLVQQLVEGLIAGRGRLSDGERYMLLYNLADEIERKEWDYEWDRPLLHVAIENEHAYIFSMMSRWREFKDQLLQPFEDGTMPMERAFEVSDPKKRAVMLKAFFRSHYEDTDVVIFYRGENVKSNALVSKHLKRLVAMGMDMTWEYFKATEMSPLAFMMLMDLPDFDKFYVNSEGLNWTDLALLYDRDKLASDMQEYDGFPRRSDYEEYVESVRLRLEYLSGL